MAGDLLVGRVALITGASAGIGAACARELSRAGMTVVLCARRRDRLDALAAELRLAGGCVHVRQIDLRDTGAIVEMWEGLRAEVGGMDVLVNNAGLGRRAPLASGETEHWREMLEVNVLALCVCTREALKDLEASGFAGQIVHIGSMAGHRVPPGSGVYSATKHAVRALTEGLRQELREKGSPVRVACISPGYVETEFAQVYALGDEDAAARTYGRFACLQPGDVAEALMYLLSQPPHVQVHDVLMRPTDQPG